MKCSQLIISVLNEMEDITLIAIRHAVHKFHIFVAEKDSSRSILVEYE